MERELEWVRGELGEERAAASRKGEDAAGRAREANSAVTRLKSLHREELKRVNKDKQQLTERVQVCCHPLSNSIMQPHLVLGYKSCAGC